MTDSVGDSWEIYTDKRGKYRWRHKATNDNIIGRACESYASKDECICNAQRHGMDGNPHQYGNDDRWEIYKDKRGHFRWRRMARNGRITGTCSEGYSSRKNCEANAKHNGKP